MKLHVDEPTCQAYGLCAEEAPNLIDLDDMGYSQIKGDGTVPADEVAAAEEAVAACPVHAMRLA